MLKIINSHRFPPCLNPSVLSALNVTENQFGTFFFFFFFWTLLLDFLLLDTSSSFGSKFLLNKATPFPSCSFQSSFIFGFSCCLRNKFYETYSFHYMPHMPFLSTRISDSFIYATCLSHFSLADLIAFLYAPLYHFHYYHSFFAFLFH